MEKQESVAAKKARLRSQFREARATLTPEARAAQSTAVSERLDALVRERSARTVSAFWPLADEIDLRPWLRALHARGVAVALPVVVSRRDETPRLEHRRFSIEGDLTTGRFGVMEPLAGPLIAPEAIEIAIVPALASDREGTRLGYGGGFYDAFLSETTALRVAALFASGVVPSLPAEPHDASLDALAAPDEIVWTGARGR